MDDMVCWSMTHISFTVTRRFSFTMAWTAVMASSGTTRCAWLGRGESVTELMPFMNFLVHSYTCCSDRHASPYWTFIRRRISMGFTPVSPLLFFGACCKRGRHIYTTTTAPSYCVPASYCHLSVVLQTISIVVVNLQDNRTVFRIFIVLLVFLERFLVIKLQSNEYTGWEKILSLITNIYYKKTTVRGRQTHFFFQNTTQEVFLQHIRTIQHVLLLLHGERLIDNQFLSTCSPTCLQLLSQKRLLFLPSNL